MWSLGVGCTCAAVEIRPPPSPPCCCSLTPDHHVYSDSLTLASSHGPPEDYDTKNLIFEVSRDRPPKMDLDLAAMMDENAMRKIKLVGLAHADKLRVWGGGRGLCIWDLVEVK